MSTIRYEGYHAFFSGEARVIESYIEVKNTGSLSGTVAVSGAKNAVLVIMASTILVDEGVCVLTNVPASADVWFMKQLLEQVGATVVFDVATNTLTVDTTHIVRWHVSQDIMKKMRASILLMGSLIARFGQADVALPGGCTLGLRPIDYHLKNLAKMGVCFQQNGDFLRAYVPGGTRGMHPARLVLEFPSVGATENLLMAAVKCPGETVIINAALEPEVMDLITVLQKMGSDITITAPATISIRGVSSLKPFTHSIIPDRLEAGGLLLAAAVTGGTIHLPAVHEGLLDTFLLKLEEMGHTISTGSQGMGITLQATHEPRAVSFKTGAFPCFPTDLQAPMMVAQTLASGTCTIEETIFENRLGHVDALVQMGASIKKISNTAVEVTGVTSLNGGTVAASDIRAACALVLAGLVSRNTTRITNIYHWKRGYESLDKKLCALGAYVHLVEQEQPRDINHVISSAISHAQVLPK